MLFPLAIENQCEQENSVSQNQTDETATEEDYWSAGEEEPQYQEPTKDSRAKSKQIDPSQTLLKASQLRDEYFESYDRDRHCLFW